MRGRKMPVRIELQELDVDDARAAAQRKPDALAGQIVGRGRALEHLGHAAGAQDHGVAFDLDRRGCRHIDPDRARDLAVANHDVGHADIAQPADARIAARLVAQRRAYRRTRAQEIDIDAALAAVTGRLDLIDLAVVAARPIDLPAAEFANPLRTALAKQRGEVLVAKAAPGAERVLEMQLRIVGLGLAERGRARHLRHDGRAAAPDHVLVEQQHPRAVAGRGDRREHSGAAAADNQDIAFKGDFVSHSSAPETGNCRWRSVRQRVGSWRAPRRMRRGVIGISHNLDAERLQRVVHRVGDRGARPDRTAFADALLPELRIGRRRFHVEDADVGHLRASRQEIVGQRRCQRLALRVERHLFEQRRADALRGAAVHLAVDDHRIDQDAGVFDHDVVEDFDAAGFRIDRDDRGVGGPGVHAGEPRSAHILR